MAVRNSMSSNLANLLVLTVVLFCTSLDITTGQYTLSFDWSVSCPLAKEGEALVRVTLYGEIFLEKDSLTVIPVENTLNYSSNSQSQHYEFEIPHPHATSGYEFRFTWTSLQLDEPASPSYLSDSSDTDINNCCWTVFNPIITTNNRSNCSEAFNVTPCYHQQPFILNDDRFWVCPSKEYEQLQMKSSTYWTECPLRVNHNCHNELSLVPTQASFNISTGEVQSSAILPPPESSVQPSVSSVQPSVSSVQPSVSSVPPSVSSVPSPVSSVQPSVSSVPPPVSSVPPPVYSLPLTSIFPSAVPTTTPSPRTTLSSPVPNVDIVCVSDGVWPPTSAGTNVTLSTGVRECFNGTVEARRFCGDDGQWGDSITCLASPIFENAFNKIRRSPVDGLNNLADELPSVPLRQSMYLLSTALDTVLESQGNTSREAFTESFLSFSANFITGSKDENDQDVRRSSGSQMLLTLDKFAIRYASANESKQLSQILLNVLEVDDVPGTGVTGIKDDQGNSITLPQHVFTRGRTKVRVASFFFPNLSHLLPPLDTNSSIISPIISSTIDCQSCPVTDLTENVTVQLRVEESQSPSQTVSCAFYEFESQDGLLPSGDWSTSGCTTTVNDDLVTCSCNHLTHFAILLSPGGPEISSTHYDVLSTIGQVLVPISLLCMVLVILTYTLIRSLWSIRNYIHIMLCASLFMAQLVFIIGVDKIENQGACSAVAVILLYLFLVTFMWMLMEGVVLYVTLVKVIIHNHKYYVIGFTLVSYFVPALYMIPVVLIGYLVNTNDIPDHTHFLYYSEDANTTTLTACWLNYSTGFIWSFIAPVIVIIMVNIGFFIMAIVIMRNHTRKHKDKENSAKFRHWLQVTISLTVVMGIAWLVGLLAFRRELLPVVYITTIFIAAQGIILFIILVPLSKQVREIFFKEFEIRKSRSSLLTRLSHIKFRNTAAFIPTSSSSNGKHSSTWDDSKDAPVSDTTGVSVQLQSIDEKKMDGPMYETITTHTSSKIKLIDDEDSLGIMNNDCDTTAAYNGDTSEVHQAEYETPVSVHDGHSKDDINNKNQYQPSKNWSQAEQNQYETIPAHH